MGEDRLEDADRIARKVAAEFQPVTTQLTGIGALPNERRPRIIYAGCEDPGSVLASMVDRLERRYGRRGFRQESRKYTPHITIARMKTPASIVSLLTGLRPFSLSSEPFETREIVLFESQLGSGSPVYTPKGRYPLAALPG